MMTNNPGKFNKICLAVSLEVSQQNVPIMKHVQIQQSPITPKNLVKSILLFLEVVTKCNRQTDWNFYVPYC